MSYVDYRKSSNEKSESKDEIEKNKKILMNNLMTNTSIQKEKIVDRLYEVVDIGALDIENHLSSILDEAEMLYSYGFYLGCISVVGLVSEELCKNLVRINNIDSGNINNQKTRIIILKTRKVITAEVSEKLDFIRVTRNNCIHYNDKFKQMNEVEVMRNSLKCLNSFKEIIKEHYEQADPLFSSATLKSNKDEIERILRNSLLKNEDMDLTISENKFLLRKRVFEILDIDIEDRYKEMTLLDTEVGIPCVVDLTYSQAEYIKETKLTTEQYIIASCISIIGDSGLSGEWQLLKIHEVLF